MRILITNCGLDGIAGTETYCYMLIGELVKRGHKIQCFTKTKGCMSDILRQEFDVESFNNIEEVRVPDVIHGHRNDLAKDAKEKFSAVPLLFVSHGIIDGEEPPEEAAHCFVVSEELQELYGGTILRNGINLNRFKPMLLEKQRDVLCIDKHRKVKDKDVFTMLPRKERDVLYIDKQVNVFNMPKLINESRVVVAKGRGALEAMACNIPTILASVHGFGGLITEDNFHHFKKCNFSARNAQTSYCQLNIDLEVNKAFNLDNYEMRHLVKREFNSKDMVDKLEKTYREITKGEGE